MLTTWRQLEDWLDDNNLEKWVVYRRDPGMREKGENAEKIVDSSIFSEGLTRDQRKQLTKRNLEAYGETCYILGYGSEKSNKGSLWNMIQLISYPSAPSGYSPQSVGSPVDEAALTERIRKELQVEFDKREFERERKDFERERKDFNDAKNGVIGAFVGYLQPYLPALKTALGSKTVGTLDAEEDVEVARIKAPETKENEEPDTFTDEEAEKLMELMERFKKIEPDHYLELFEAMVCLAESGDSSYKMAKQFLLQ